MYRSEEDTIRKLIKIEEEAKHKMTKNAVYDHVQYECNQVRETYDAKFVQISEKLDNEVSILNNKLTSMKLLNEKRDTRLDFVAKDLARYKSEEVDK